MSLLNKNKAFNVRDYLFLAVGLLCLFGFFLGYSSQEPRSTIDMGLGENSASAKAVEVFSDLGYSSEELQSTITFQTNRKLLDSLQVQFGRQDAINVLSDSLNSGIFPYYWEMKVQNNARKSFQEGPVFNPGQEGETILRLNEQGKLIEFLNPLNIFPNRIVNREALIAAFDADQDLEFWKSLPDSAWHNVLRFDIEEGYGNIQPADTVNIKQSEASSHTFTRANIEQLANYHLQNSGWELDNLDITDIQVETMNSRPVAEIIVENTRPIIGQNVMLDMVVLPTGALLSLNATYNSTSDERGLPGILTFFRVAVILLFGLAVIILFYFRIRSRAIDTKPALVVGVIAGLIIPARILLERLSTRPLFGNGVETVDLLGTALNMGFSGALASIGFFAVFAVSDSLMRQYWPEKLFSYDYLRQGMLFNKPVGETILRSVVLSFILCGIWTISLFFFPDLYFEIERTFLHFEAAWPPVYLFLNSAWFSLIVILGIFAIVGTKVYGLYQNKLITGIVTVVGLTVVAPVFQAVNPAAQELAFFAILGVSFAFIFLKWDILTILFTHFLFILMLEVSSGWLVGASPDFYVFVVFSVFLLFIVIAGVLFISMGKEQQSLSTYVPQYVEELAQEERIKQELQIAREVQQSFLPVQTPRFDYLELAAICKPAYETGGDYYDFVVLDDNRVAVTIGDVSGKGIQAAFFMTFVKGVLHSLCREIDSPAEILKKANRLFYENAPRGTFISLIYGIVDLEKNVFRFARAGHNPVLRLNSSKGTVEALQPKGIGIGLTREAIFDQNIEEVELDLTGGDLLVLYTDGIVEALNKNHKFYGLDRLNKILLKNRKHSAADILEKISNDVRSYIADAKQHDDMTMLVMKLKKH
jgi:serine phosphatase RsbU (regulator of sigma subunit)